ncbi:MAG: multidrug transporter, partial [Planctomycetes bacterium]|nr:multidrug transporter [Planctomycetota bacterium]
MAKLFIYATAGANDPTRACLPFFIGTGASEEGHEVQLALAGDATVLVPN